MTVTAEWGWGKLILEIYTQKNLSKNEGKNKDFISSNVGGSLSAEQQVRDPG